MAPQRGQKWHWEERIFITFLTFLLNPIASIYTLKRTLSTKNSFLYRGCPAYLFWMEKG